MSITLMSMWDHMWPGTATCGTACRCHMWDHMSVPHVALVCSGPPQKRGHLWVNKVTSVLAKNYYYTIQDI